MKKVTLINPPWFFDKPENLVLSQNLGIGYLAAYLEQNGHTVTVIDALAEGYDNIKSVTNKYRTFYRVGLSYRDITGKIEKDTDFIGITAPYTNHARIIKELSHFIKMDFPNVPIILGGVYPSMAPQEAKCASIDYYVIGEGEKALLELVSAKNVDKIRGVFTALSPQDSFVPAEIFTDLDQLPFPARRKLPMEKYLAFRSPRREKKRSASIITSRGCPYGCEFCSIKLITGKNWRKRSAENVIIEIEQLIGDYDIEHIEFEDDNLTLDKARSIKIFEGIEKINRQRKKISWSTPNGVRFDTLDRELLCLIKKSNCSSLSLGIESADPVILKKMNKELDLDKALEIADVSKEMGIALNAFFMIGYPGETGQSFKKTLDFVKQLKKRGVGTFYYTYVRAYPGTGLFETCLKEGYIKPQDGNERLYLADNLDPGNSITTPDFNTRVLRKRAALFNKLTVPFYLRFYRRHLYFFRRLIPESWIERIKQFLK
jgi:magnesium-protoporphyrin IX monomethyl ester (oxidative) cyclase